MSKKSKTVQPIIVSLTDKVGEFKAGTARAEWYNRLVEFDGQPVSDFLESVTASPPSLPTKGKSAGTLEPPAGWLRWFRKEGYVELQ